VIDAAQIPDDAVEAFAKAFNSWERKSNAECIAAALAAWPGMTYMEPNLANGVIILPLPAGGAR
jgi:hypothetical protein